MAHSFDTFKVELIDRVYLRNDGFTTPRTARIQLFDARGKVIIEYALAAPIIPEIYESIGRGETVNLDECYLHGFSLTACRRFLILDKNTVVKINGFSARNAVFETAFNIDLSYGEFDTDTFTVDGSIFIGKELTFHSSTFNTNGINFANCFIKVDKFDMVMARFNDGEINFKNTIFDKGSVDFQDVDFGSGDVNFTNTEFGEGDVSFVNTRFNDGDVSFKVARFGHGKVDFHYAKFGKGNISFERAEFGTGRIDFRTVEFGKGKTSFNRCVFGDGEVNFEGAEAHYGKVSFRKSIFGNGVVSFELYHGKGSELVFEKVAFPADISFAGLVAESLILDACQFNSTLNLHVEECETLNMTGSVIRDIADYYTHGPLPKVKTLNLAGVRLLGQFYCDWETNYIDRLIYDQEETTVAEKAEQFRILKENFGNLGKYTDEDKAYVEFKRCDQKAILQSELKGNFFKRITAYIKYYFELVIFDWVGLYATAPSRVIFSMIVIYAIFSLLYTGVALSGLGAIIPGTADGEKLGLVVKGFYFSVITFFTIGYGDFAPSGIARLVSGFEGFCGVFMMSYFTVAFVRKILR
ncbi:MAG: hypothetical protein HOO91_12950 [Bacteroidales bacterium]|nr:hypothetical protein [Bacteroidales bacterium]